MRIRKGTKEFVKIIIGKGELGFRGMKKPMKSISVEDTSVEEIYKKIVNMINRENKDGI